MEEQLFKTLKAFRNIKPDQSYAEKSRRMILSVPRTAHPIANIFQRLADTVKYSVALGMAMVMVFLMIGGFSYFKVTNLSPLVLTSFDESNGLQQEAQGLDFRIQLGQAKYFDEATQQVADSEREINALLDKIAL